MLRSNSDGSRKNCERGPVKIKYGGPPHTPPPPWERDEHPHLLASISTSISLSKKTRTGRPPPDSRVTGSTARTRDTG